VHQTTLVTLSASDLLTGPNSPSPSSDYPVEEEGHLAGGITTLLVSYFKHSISLKGLMYSEGHQTKATISGYLPWQ
jgi:hypothetical protein